jgi:POT family proton-dependent oligopeptide transporter
MPMLAIGIGLFKPVIPVMVGKTAPDGSAMQSGRMSKFYSWVNVGGFVGPLLLGWLYATISPRVAFMSAAVASLGALAVVLGGWNKLASVDVRNPVESLAGVRLDIEVPDAAADEPQAEIIWRIRKLLVLCALSVVFWVGYHAFFGPVALWLENTVNKKVWGFEIPTAWFQTINPALLILTGMLAPSLFAGWSLRSRVFAALAATVLGYFGLAMLSRWGVGVPLWSAVAVVLVVSVGELLISPLGLATVSALAPKKHTGAFMAIWYAASAIGGYLSGLMGNRAGALEFGVMAVAGLLGTIATVACWRLLGDFSVFQELQTHRARLINKISSRATAHQLINAPAVVEHPQ